MVLHGWVGDTVRVIVCEHKGDCMHMFGVRQDSRDGHPGLVRVAEAVDLMANTVASLVEIEDLQHFNWLERQVTSKASDGIIGMAAWPVLYGHARWCSTNHTDDRTMT